LSLLAKDSEAALYASPILDAFYHSPEQFAGVMAHFKVLLERLLDKDLFWVLSGHDVPLTVNDPADPLVVCLGNTPSQKGFLSPILSMIIAVLMGNMYGHDRNKSFIVMDELPTLLLPGLCEVPATARKYQIVTVVALQNFAQLERSYGSVGAREIRETFSNHLIGRGPYSLSRDMSDMMGKKSVVSTSTTKTDREASKTIHQVEERVTRPEEGMMLQVGEFMGNVASCWWVV
jgi:type IV secretory pathway TraG/TraD family ATPase VirD4